jgi:hypothetical protein
MSCAPNLCKRKLLKKRKLEEKKMKKTHVGARADGAARGRSKQPHAILVLRTIFRVILVKKLPIFSKKDCNHTGNTF